MDLSQSIKTVCTDGLWFAHMTHPLLGYIEGSGLSEQMALAKWRERLREVAQVESTARYKQLREKHPNHNWSKSA